MGWGYLGQAAVLVMKIAISVKNVWIIKIPNSSVGDVSLASLDTIVLEPTCPKLLLVFVKSMCGESFFVNIQLNINWLLEVKGVGLE